MKALTTLLTDIADAIREKKGTTELINPQDFSTEIRGISGGNADGGVTIRYFNIKALIDMISQNNLWDTASSVLGTFISCKATVGDIILIYPFTMFGEGYRDGIFQAAIVDNMILTKSSDNSAGEVNTNEIISNILQQGCFEITKEQFYDLTTEI